MKTKRWGRRLAMLLVTTLLLSCLPLGALAAGEGTLPGAPEDQPTGDYTMAETCFSGVSDEPMSDADVQSYFRIPALITLENGWVVAASDARWPNTNDSPNNLDTIVSVSKDGGETWEWEIVNYFADFAPIQGPTYYPGSSKEGSASFIDPALAVDGNGTLWMAVDLQPPGVNGGKNPQKTGSGFDEDGLLMVGPLPESEWAQKVNTTQGRTEETRAAYAAHYEYRVDIRGTADRTVEKDGAAVSLYPIFHKDDGDRTPVGYYVDAFFDLWYDHGGTEGLQPVLCLQKDATDTWIQANLFYKQSPWKAYSTTYLMTRTATVNETAGKLEWSEPMLIDGVKKPGETFLAFCPGRGSVITLGNGKERILFPVYDNLSGEKVSTVYSDDGGATWARGERIQNGDTTKTSESQVVTLPGESEDGTPLLRIYSRNEDGYISYSDSQDGGVTWTASRQDKALKYGNNVMVSFINVEGCLVSPDNQVYENVILASYPWGGVANGEHNRSNGVLRIGTVDAATMTVTWLNENVHRFPGRYNYSCLTQYRDETGGPADQFAVLYEQDDTSNPAKGVMAMRFVKFTVADLLGDGWVLAKGKPTVGVTLNVDTTLVDLDHNGRRKITPAYSPADAVVTWTSSDESVVTVQDGILVAVGAGTATVTVSVTKGPLTRSASIPVTVQPESGALLLPEAYVDQITTTVTPASTRYVLDEDGVGDVPYMFYSQGGNRVLHNNTNRNATDHCTPAMEGDKTIMASHTADNWQPTDDLWRLVSQGNGNYYIQSLTDSKYVTATATGTQLVLGDAGVPFTVTHQGGGEYQVKNGSGYLTFSGGWRVQSDAAVVKLFGEVTTQETTTYTVAADGLRRLLQAAGVDEGTYTEVLALATDYDSAAAAQAAQERINAAAQEVYAQLRLEGGTRYLVTYTVQGALLAAQSYYPGEIIVPMTDPVRPGYVFTGWTGMPADKVMPDHDLTLEAAFRVIEGGGSSGGSRPGPSKPAETGPKEPDTPTPVPTPQPEPEPEQPKEFTDISAGHWAADAIRKMADRGLLQGVGEGRFAPAAPMTRASLATVLYRLAGGRGRGEAAFADVPGNAWYADEVAWAAEAGVVAGIGNGLFAPQRSVTREELAVMLCRQGALMGLNTTAPAQYVWNFADGDAASAWAVESMAWCVAKDILRGKEDGRLAPTDVISRAEVAVMLDRFVALLPQAD